MHRIHFHRDLSNSALNSYADETLVLGGDFNCALTELDKRGGRTNELNKVVTQEKKG